MLRTWQHEGLLNPRGWVEPTQFVLVDEGGRVVYRMVAPSAWSDRQMSIQDPEGRLLASLNKKWKWTSSAYKLVRANRVDATITYKDTVWRWRDRYVIKLADGRKIVGPETSVGSMVYEFSENRRMLARYSRPLSERTGRRKVVLEVVEGLDPLLFAATALSIVLSRGGALGD